MSDGNGKVTEITPGPPGGGIPRVDKIYLGSGTHGPWVEICRNRGPTDDEIRQYKHVVCYIPLTAEYARTHDHLVAFFDGIGRAMEHCPDFIKRFYDDIAIRIAEARGQV